ncbi:MAG: hypothetical protein FWE69_07200 [Clostridiales bacterium]|nr:hypothetical protein [Clostridiales bacterium]
MEMAEKKKTYKSAYLMAFLVSPIAVTFGVYASALFVMLIESLYPLGWLGESVLAVFVWVLFITLPTILLVFLWRWHTKKTELPEKASALFKPLFLSFCYYMLAWILLVGVGYHTGSDLLHNMYSLLSLPYYFLNWFFDFGWPHMIILVTIVSAATILLTCAVKGKAIVFDKRIWICLAIFLLLSGIAAFQLFELNRKFPPEERESVQAYTQIDTI